jgi:hypothetical protein
MKKRFIILLVLSCLLFQNCRSWTITQITNTNAPISPKLPALQKGSIYGQPIYTPGMAYYNTDIGTIFTEEVENNLTDPFGEVYGTINYHTNMIQMKIGIGYALVSGFTMMVPNLLGFPMGNYKIELETIVEIRNVKNELIGKYKATGKGKASVAMYFGYGSVTALRKARADALNNCLINIRVQIQQDVLRLTTELKNAKAVTGN